VTAEGVFAARIVGAAADAGVAALESVRREEPEIDNHI